MSLCVYGADKALHKSIWLYKLTVHTYLRQVTWRGRQYQHFCINSDDIIAVCTKACLMFASFDMQI